MVLISIGICMVMMRISLSISRRCLQTCFLFESSSKNIPPPMGITAGENGRTSCNAILTFVNVKSNCCKASSIASASDPKNFFETASILGKYEGICQYSYAQVTNDFNLCRNPGSV